MKSKENITVFLTGATGTMGGAFLKEYASDRRRYPYRLKVLARPSKKNRKFLSTYEKEHGVEIIWGDLTSYDDLLKGVAGSDYVLHVGGLVSPAADYFPEKTLKTNVEAAANIVTAVKAQPNADHIRVVYIGSVAQCGMRHAPHHWGRAGDPVWAAEFDNYALSKIAAERIIAEGGLTHWVSLRQSGILSPLILKKGSDPITFHVPQLGVLEWATDEDSGRLLARICDPDIPEKFWNNFYNIGSGDSFRLTNYDFEALMLKALSCPAPEKVFGAGWFASRNFHGMWYEDSDLLEQYIGFRGEKTVHEYFMSLKDSLPPIFRLASIVPSFIIKAVMKFVASKAPFGPFYWKRTADTKRLKAFFGTENPDLNANDWSKIRQQLPKGDPVRLSHGYDETKPNYLLDINDMKQAAAFRGGKCLDETMTPGDLSTPLMWQCHKGHTFHASPRIILKGGHWCQECFSDNPDYEDIALHNPFFAQVYK